MFLETCVRPLYQGNGGRFLPLVSFTDAKPSLPVASLSVHRWVMETSLVDNSSCPILWAISRSRMALLPGWVVVHPSWLIPSPWPHITVFPLPFILDPTGQASLTWSIAMHFFFCVIVSTHVAVACTAPRPGVCVDDLNMPWYRTTKAAENWGCWHHDHEALAW